MNNLDLLDKRSDQDIKQDILQCEHKLKLLYSSLLSAHNTRVQ